MTSHREFIKGYRVRPCIRLGEIYSKICICCVKSLRFAVLATNHSFRWNGYATQDYRLPKIARIGWISVLLSPDLTAGSSAA